VFCERLNFTTSDIIGLQYFMLRYATSSSARREDVAESISLLDYVAGSEPKKRYSDAALHFIDHAPRALAAMSATDSDARTQINTSLQLLAIKPTKEQVADMTLNGPTSSAWLDHWKRYLKAQGVTFFAGKLKSLEMMEGRYVPVVEGPDDWSSP